jgi:soluble lytic murein transglycosylase-like protein
MQRGHFGEAEAAWVLALSSFDQPPPSDVRVRATLSHLVRLASIYQRLKRPDEANHVMAIVDDYVSAPDRASLRALDYAARFQHLSELTLDHVYRANRDLAEVRRDFEPTLAALIRRTARKYRVDPHLVKAVVAVESNFDTLAVSEKGAQGLMQLMPATAREMGVDSPFKPSENIRGGVRYLRSMLDRYSDLGIALAAYNAGPVAVDRYGGIPPFPETKAYVERVLQFYHEYRDE